MIHFWSTFSAKPNIGRVAKMVKCKKSVPKALIKGGCLWLHESTTFSGNLMLFGHFEVFISP